MIIDVRFKGVLVICTVRAKEKNVLNTMCPVSEESRERSNNVSSSFVNVLLRFACASCSCVC